MCPVSVIQVGALFGNITSLQFKYSTNWPIAARPNESVVYAARGRPKAAPQDQAASPAGTSASSTFGLRMTISAPLSGR